MEYRQIREEVRAEHALLSNRLTWYATSQSFLVTAFTISRANGFTWHPWYSTLLLPLLGLCVSLLIFPSIIGACKTIRLWHGKQKTFFERNPDFRVAFDLQRAPWIQSRGLLFPQFMPILFGIFWVIIFVRR